MSKQQNVGNMDIESGPSKKSPGSKKATLAWISILLIVIVVGTNLITYYSTKNDTPNPATSTPTPAPTVATTSAPMYNTYATWKYGLANSPVSWNWGDIGGGTITKLLAAKDAAAFKKVLDDKVKGWSTIPKNWRNRRNFEREGSNSKKHH